MANPETPVTQNQPQAISDVKAFRARRQERDQGAVVELPSGLSVKVKRPSVPDLIKKGHIPADVAASMQNVAPGKQMRGEEMTKYLELMDLIVRFSVVEPQVAPEGQEPTDAQLTMDDFEDMDKQFIMSYVQSGVTDLTPFRTVAQS